MESQQPLTVTRLNAYLKDCVESNFASVWVEAEISQITYHSSGHVYLTLKDPRSQIKTVIWKQVAMRIPRRFEAGDMVEIIGRATVYEARGELQFVVEEIRPKGLGALQIAFEALKARLSEAGWFDDDRKRPLPPIPLCVGVVTSPTGQAIRDILQILRRRAPYVRVILAPAQVQGEGAAASIVRAIQQQVRLGQAEVLIVGRGGGSLEDLWAFNLEEVLTVIHECPIPVISAVGHEGDVTLADFVADKRASTPSAAAELVAPTREELMGEINYGAERVRTLVEGRVEILTEKYRRLHAQGRFDTPYRLLEDQWQRLDRGMAEMTRSIVDRQRDVAQRAELAGVRLLARSPLDEARSEEHTSELQSQR